MSPTFRSFSPTMPTASPTMPTGFARSSGAAAAPDRRLPRRAALLGLLALPLAACGSAASDGTGAGASDGGGSDAGGAAAPITVEDPWIKATDTDMTGAFAILRNPGSADLTLVGARCEDAGMVELHEVTDGAMRPVEGGLDIPAGGELLLEPGGYHVMLMDLRRELVPDDQVTVELELEGGATVPMNAVVKDFSGAKEDYSPGGSDGGGDHAGHDDHDGHDGHDGHDDHAGHDGEAGHAGHEDHAGHDGHDDHAGHDAHDGHAGHDDHGEDGGH